MHKEHQDDSSTPPIYKLKPEGWLQQIHAAADLGKPAMVSSGQGTDATKVILVFILPILVRRRIYYLFERSSMDLLPNQGYLWVLKWRSDVIHKTHMWKAEAFSAKAVIEGFHSDEVFSKLEELMNELFTRRADKLPAIPWDVAP